MESDNSDRIDQVDNALDDLKTTVEEIKEDPPPGARSETIDALRDALEKASDAADELEGQKD